MEARRIQIRVHKRADSIVEYLIIICDHGLHAPERVVEMSDWCDRARNTQHANAIEGKRKKTTGKEGKRRKKKCVSRFVLRVVLPSTSHSGVYDARGELDL